MGQPTSEEFLNDVKNHVMTVKRDDGVYRHLRFASPEGWNQWFEVLTWPNRLIITGDMGTYVFSRIEDMFTFFRRGQGLRINPSYWGEKLQAVDSTGGRDCGYRTYSSDVLCARVKEYVDQWIEDNSLDDDSAKELRDEVQELTDNADNEYRAYDSLGDFQYDTPAGKFEFGDFWEWNLREYTYRFIWCLYAIVWAIQQYDKAKQPEKG